MTRKCLIAVAAPAEANAVLAAWGQSGSGFVPWVPLALDSQFDLLVTGIGKANAAGAIGHAAGAAPPAAVISTGIAGALPGSAVSIGNVIAASECVFADEGVQTDESFTDCAAMGFPLGDFPGSAVPVHEGLSAFVRPLAGACGPIATVSTCSGTDCLANAVRERTGALAEAMEGAAVALVAWRLRMPMAEIRVISNTTGRRSTQRWDLKTALARLSDVCSRMRTLSLPTGL